MSPRSLLRRVQNRYRRVTSTKFAAEMIPLRALPSGLITFTFDDFPANALHTAGSILEARGFAATYFVAIGLAEQEGPVGRYFARSDLPEVLQRGHELGCHTYDHCHAWTTPRRIYAQSIARNRSELQAIVPGEEFATHSYPISIPHPANKRAVASLFNCARGGKERLNAQLTDRWSLHTVFIERQLEDLAHIKAILDQARGTGSWLVLATHDVSDSPTRFGCTTRLFSEIADHVTKLAMPVLPLAKAFDYVTRSSRSETA